MTQLTAPPTYKIQWVLYGEVTPKARPRVGKNRTILPPKYAAWKDGAIIELRVLAYQLSQNTRSKLPLSRVSVSVHFYGSLSPKADLDNGVGSILDALVQADVLKDDSRSHVLKLSCEFHPIGKLDDPRTEIIIEPIPFTN